MSVLRRRNRLHLAMGFAAGALIGVALFETLPEAFELAGDGNAALVVVAAVLGGLSFRLLEGSLLGHIHTEDAVCNPRAGHIGAAGLTAHALLDGLAIGSAFQADATLGALVTVAVLLHAFSDGLNTVTVVLRHGHPRSKAIAWLAADATAPIAGAVLGLFVTLSDLPLGLLLALFAGMFIYIGAGSLLPEAHASARSRRLVAATTAAGVTMALTAALVA
jgi:ZIP family zinc transporter